jgi:peptidoglycan/xylan/chitin deacetylase (PgdA/CDA1 family)
VSDPGLLRPLAGPPGTRLGTLLGEGLEPVAPLRAGRASFPRVVAEAAADEDSLAAAGEGLAAGAALPEAIAVRLRDAGVELRWGDPVIVAALPALLELCRARGRSSVELARADPSLLTGMQLGAWFDAPWRTRLLRRLARGPLRRAVGAPALRSRRLLLAACDLEFWAGARELASAGEWRRLSASSYVALVYHRFAGELKPGQERIDIAPRRFRRQLRALRLLGFRPLEAERLISFHADPVEGLPRRSVVITVDDAIADSVETLLGAADWRPQLFVPTGEVGGAAHWIGGEPVAGWGEIRDLAAAGVAIGSHARSHRRLTTLPAEEADAELSGALADLRRELVEPLEVLAYPNGDHDEAICRAARRAGYRAAYTTEKGRNGAGADPWCLKRVSVHGRDGVPAVLWKALTGVALPAFWLRARSLLHRADPSS